MKRRAVGIGAAVLVAVAVVVLSLLALARGSGSDSAIGKVISITDVATGKVVCVRDDESGRTQCGEIAQADLPGRLDSVEVGGCAYIKVARDAALKLERRPCS
jgi:hypothetical protein